ncbi:MAG: hypothetical protein ACK502_09465 [Alphaproteobacteria bacterium]
MVDEPNPVDKFMKDAGIAGAFHGATDAVAKTLSEKTNGGISENTTKSIMPWMAGGAAALVGMLLLQPIHWLVKGTFKALRNIVTLGGMLENIPIIGGLFTAIGDVIDTIAEYAGYVVPAIGAFIGYKAFQTAPSPEPKTPLDTARELISKTTDTAGDLVKGAKSVGNALVENATEIGGTGAIAGTAALVGARANNQQAALSSEEATARLKQRLEARYGEDGARKIAEKVGFDKSPLSAKDAATVEEIVVKHNVDFDRQKEAEALKNLRPGFLNRIGNALKPVGKIIYPVVKPFAPLVTIPYNIAAMPFRVAGGVWNLGANAAYKVTGGRIGHNDQIEAVKQSMKVDARADAAKEALRRQFTIDDAVAESIKEEFTAKRDPATAKPPTASDTPDAPAAAKPNAPAAEASPTPGTAKAPEPPVNPAKPAASTAQPSPGSMVKDGYRFSYDPVEGAVARPVDGIAVPRQGTSSSPQSGATGSSGRTAVMDAPEAPAQAPRTATPVTGNTMTAAENIALQMEASEPLARPTPPKAQNPLDTLLDPPTTQNNAAKSPNLTARTGFVRLGSGTGFATGLVVLNDPNADGWDKAGGWALTGGGLAGLMKPQLAGPLAPIVTAASAPLVAKTVSHQIGEALDSSNSALERLEAGRQAATTLTFAAAVPLLLAGGKQLVTKVAGPIAVADLAVNSYKLGDGIIGANSAMNTLDQALEQKVDTENFVHLLVLSTKESYLAKNSPVMAPHLKNAVRNSDGYIDLNNPDNIPMLRGAITAALADSTNKIDAYETIGPRWLWSGDRIKYYSDAQGDRNTFQAALAELDLLEQKLKVSGKTVPSHTPTVPAVDIMAKNDAPDLTNYSTLRHLAEVEQYLPDNGSTHYYLHTLIKRDENGKIDFSNPANIEPIGKWIVALEKDAKLRADLIDGTWLNDNETKHYNAASKEAAMYGNAFAELKDYAAKWNAEIKARQDEEAKRKAAEEAKAEAKRADELEARLRKLDAEGKLSLGDVTSPQNGNTVAHSSTQPIPRPTNDPNLPKPPQKGG